MNNSERRYKSKKAIFDLLAMTRALAGETETNQTDLIEQIKDVSHKVLALIDVNESQLDDTSYSVETDNTIDIFDSTFMDVTQLGGK